MSPFYTSFKILNSIHFALLLPSLLLLFLLHSGAEVTGHLTYLEAMTSQDEMEPSGQMEDFYQDHQDEDDDPEEYYDVGQKLDLDSLQDILDYSVEVEGREEVEERKENKEKQLNKEEEDSSIRQFALMISRMLYQLANM